MDIFDKQWDCGMLSGSKTTFGQPANKEIARFAWRAALKWTLEDIKKTYGDDFSESEFVKHVEEELKDD